MKRTADGEAKEVEEQEEEEGVPTPQQPDAVAESALQNFTPEQQLAYQQQWQAYYQQQQYYQQQAMVEQGPPYYGTFGRPARKQVGTAPMTPANQYRKNDLSVLSFSLFKFWRDLLSAH